MKIEYSKKSVKYINPVDKRTNKRLIEAALEGRKMDSYIDLKDIVTEELKHVDLDRVNVTCSPPDVEPQRQYYFMAKCRQIVKSESERLGRPLYACIQTFGCQMNTEHEIEKAA